MTVQFIINLMWLVFLIKAHSREPEQGDTIGSQYYEFIVFDKSTHNLIIIKTIIILQLELTASMGG